MANDGSHRYHSKDLERYGGGIHLEAYELLPLLSEADPEEKVEGSIDPLGLYLIADRLALRLVPGVRERMDRPRFLTIMAVGQEVTRDFQDRLANDGITPPWLAYEWLIVEALVQEEEGSEAIKSLPGSLKARDALKHRAHLSAKNYLKTPKVFGFHGVYRLLAHTLDILDERQTVLGEAGWQLLRIWEREQGLAGFAEAGHEFKGQLQRAVRSTLDSGSVPWLNPGLREGIARHLAPGRLGRKERGFLHEALLTRKSGHRAEVLEALVSKQGSRCWKDKGSERAFHALLQQKASPLLSMLLDGIIAYEGFARCIQDAFDDCLFNLSQGQSKLSADALAKSSHIRKAAEIAPSLYGAASERLADLGLQQEFVNGFAGFVERMPPERWVDTLLEFHRETQKRKPPEGKAPWVVRLDNGSYMVRPLYARKEGGRHALDYVHGYRTGSLWTFAKDLRLASDE